MHVVCCVQQYSEKVLAHTRLDFFLSAAPSALLLLLLWASSICCTLAVLGLSWHSRVGYPSLPTCFHSLPRNPTAPQQSGSFPSVLPALAPLRRLCAFSEGSKRPDTFGTSISFYISWSCYCALVREAWDANNVFWLRYRMSNQETGFSPGLVTGLSGNLGEVRPELLYSV